MRALLLVGLLGTALPHLAPRQPAPSFAFHHLHLNDSRPPFLINFYERLFDPAMRKRTSTAGLDTLQAGSMLLFISRAPSVREQATAIWHFGWGTVSLGETYLAHARREVAWEPPLPPDRLHLHLRSVTPSLAAAWYRDVLGARVELAAPGRAVDMLPRPEHRMPEALVWIGETGLLIYRTEPPLFSTRGQRADHIAIGCLDLEAALSLLRDRGATVLAGPSGTETSRTAIIEGPDHIAIELVELK